MNNNPHEVSASRQFNKSVEELYDAWINGDKLKEWWQPAGNKLISITNDVRKGGNMQYHFETSRGDASFTISGQYKEVEPAAKLVYTWNWQMPGSENADNHFELTVLFSGDSSNSNIHITQQDLDKQESIHPHQKGWEEELARLATFLGE